MVQSRKDALAALAALWDGAEDRPHDTSAAYALQTSEGRRLYESFTDDELITILWEAARQLGHSPAQKEVFWVYREYLKHRFGKWPYALRQAGLHASAGKGGLPLQESEAMGAKTQMLLERVRQAANNLGRIPHPSDLPEVCQALRREFHSWNDVLDAAEVRQVRTVRRIEDLDEETRRTLEALHAEALARGRAPLRAEVSEETRAALSRACGSWRNALFQIGLEPVTHINAFSGTKLGAPRGQTPRHGSALYDCLYRLLSPDDDTRADLAALKALSEALGREPGRRDMPPELRRRLQNSCGSIANAVFQLQYLKETTDTNL